MRRTKTCPRSPRTLQTPLEALREAVYDPHYDVATRLHCALHLLDWYRGIIEPSVTYRIADMPELF
jgi:hypothetical protein